MKWTSVAYRVHFLNEKGMYAEVLHNFACYPNSHLHICLNADHQLTGQSPQGQEAVPKASYLCSLVAVSQVLLCITFLSLLFAISGVEDNMAV